MGMANSLFTDYDAFRRHSVFDGHMQGLPIIGLDIIHVRDILSAIIKYTCSILFTYEKQHIEPLLGPGIFLRTFDLESCSYLPEKQRLQLH